MYQVFNYKNIDMKLSEKLEKIFECEPRYCYGNVLSIAYKVQKEKLANEIKIVYGYYGVISERMTRHCFLINDGKIIDPTSYKIAEKFKFDYQIFKIYSTNEYLKECVKYYQKLNKQEIEEAPWLEYFIPEEKIYCRYVIENQIPIDKFSYDTFLEKYDVDNKVIVIE